MIRRALASALLFSVAFGACTNAVSSSPTDPTLPTLPSTTIPETTTSTVPVLEAVEAFRLCLNDNGAALETIPFDAQNRPRLDLVFVNTDLSDPAGARALEECSSHLISGALSAVESPVMQEMVVDTLTSFSECVRSQGVLMFPDPVAGFIGIGGPYPIADIPYDHPGLEMAVEVCRSRLAAEAS